MKKSKLWICNSANCCGNGDCRHIIPHKKDKLCNKNTCIRNLTHHDACIPFQPEGEKKNHEHVFNDGKLVIEDKPKPAERIEVEIEYDEYGDGIRLVNYDEKTRKLLKKLIGGELQTATFYLVKKED